MSLSGHDTPSATLPPIDGDTANGPPSAAGRWHRSGDTVSRYMVVDMVGAGGMGVVYAAYDPELDRKVALKLLRADVTRNRAQARRRFVREAKAMAQLAHPNVITVHDAGTADDEAFLTMEFVDGKTLAEWLEGSPRTTEEVIDVFLQAGRGLAAAHDANIVHRDFKPENVLIRRDGRVLVTDFGLARAADTTADSLSEDDAAEAPTGSARDLAIPLTRTGAILGTPAYMAPEQRFGLAAGAAADQFSFCVAMYEALYGHRPFAGITVHEVFDAIVRQEFREPAPGTRVPGRLRRVLLRGLRAKPEERHASMHELLSELRPPRRTGARIAALVVAAAVVGGVAATLAATDDEYPCMGIEDALDDVWNDATQGRVKAALVASGSTEANDMWNRIRNYFDGYARDWTEMQRQACVAFHIEHSQDETTYDATMRCLDERRVELRTSAEVLGELEPEDLPRALGALSIIHPLARCEPGDQDSAPLVADAAFLEQREALLSVDALWELGRRDAALARAREAVASAPTEASRLYADLTLARVLIDMGKAEGATLMESVFHRGIESRDFGVVSPAAVYWMDALSRDPSRLREAEIVGTTALSITRSLNPDGAVEAGIHLGLSRLYSHQGRPRDAIDELLPLYEALDPEDDPYTMLDVTMQLGVGYHKLGDQERASELQRQSLDLANRLHGETSRHAVVRLTNLAEIESSRGRLAESLRYAKQATEAALDLGDSGLFVIGNAVLRTGASHLAMGELDEALPLIRWALGLRVNLTGPESYPSAEAAGVHAVALSELGDRVAALRELERVLAIQRKLLPPGDRMLTITLNNAGSEALSLGDHDKARRYHREALEMRLEHDAPDADVAITLNNLADVELAEGHLQAAVAGYESALARWKQSSAAGSAYPSWTWHGMGMAKAKQGDLDGARVALENALDGRKAGAVSRDLLGQTRYELAKVEAAAGNEGRARALADLARDDLEGEDEAAEVAAWIEAGLPPP